MEKFKIILTKSLLEVAANEMFMLNFSPDPSTTHPILIQPHLLEMEMFALSKTEDFQILIFLVEY